MKNIFLFIQSVLFILTFSNAFGQGGWILRESGTPNNLRSISSFDGMTIVSVGDSTVIGDSATVVSSENGGETWQVQKDIFWKDWTRDHVGMHLNGVVALGPKIFCAVGCKDTVFRTTDGGISWKGYRSRGKGSCLIAGNISAFTKFTAIDFDTTNHVCIAVGPGGMAIFSSDSGKYWEENLPPSTDYISCVSSYKGISLAGAGVGNLFITLNKGDSWVTDWVGRTNSGNNFDFYGADVRGWVCVGQDGTIFKSLDKGKNWILIPSGTIANLNAVHFADKANGYIVGDGGLVLYTDDGGSSWKRQSTPTKENLRSVHFVDPFIGFICGDNGTILTTTNGGYSPEAVSAAPQTSGYSIKVYPNPTSLRTTVSVNIPHISQIHLRIYDMLGKEIASLANGVFEAGIQSFPWNISSIANGVYICKLEAEGMILQSQVVVQK